MEPGTDVEVQHYDLSTHARIDKLEVTVVEMHKDIALIVEWTRNAQVTARMFSWIGYRLIWLAKVGMALAALWGVSAAWHAGKPPSLDVFK